MNSEVNTPAVSAFEVRKQGELIRDEDVLSHDLRAALEDVGGALGLIGAVALVFAQLARGRRAVVAMKAARHG